MSISVFSARSTMENKPFNGVTDQAPRATPVSKYLILYNVRVSFVTSPLKHQSGLQQTTLKKKISLFFRENNT